VTRETLFAAVLRVLHAWTRRLPAADRHRWARRLARLTPLLTPARWRAVQANLDVIAAHGGRPASPLRVFENFAVSLSDFVAGARPHVKEEGREKAEAARRRGHGAVFLTSHLGRWELGAHILAEWGWKATAVYQPYRSASLRRFIESRRAPGIDFVPVGRGAAAAVARALRRKETVIFLGDRPFGERGLPVRLCGRTARLPSGPFRFACRHGAPIIPGFVLADAAGHCRAVVDDALWPRGKDDASVQELLERTAKVLEKFISNHAEQWYCFESVWAEDRG
jgi:KDO2-lipid IV(A) lauroyltransferase